MSTFMLKNTSLNFTPVSNAFIEKYMPSARGEFVKVYLLMLKYNTSSEPGVSSSIIASSLNLLESDIMNALNYWNEQGVIKLLPIDNMNNFKVEFLPLADEPSIKSKEVNLLAALNNNQTKDMLKDIEKILGRTLSNQEMQTYLSWQTEFMFSSELILLLIQYCATKGKTNFRYIEKVAISWNELNIRTREEAQNHIKQDEDKWTKIRKILNYLGIKNPDIMKPQQAFLEKWVSTYNFDLPLIEKACDKCFERLNHADFKYIDAILTGWFNKNIKTLRDVQISDEKFKNSNNKGNYKITTKSKPNNGFNNFEPRSYDYDSLEKKLLGWDKDD